MWNASRILLIKSLVLITATRTLAQAPTLSSPPDFIKSAVQYCSGTRTQDPEALNLRAAALQHLGYSASQSAIISAQATITTSGGGPTSTVNLSESKRRFRITRSSGEALIDTAPSSTQQTSTGPPKLRHKSPPSLLRILPVFDGWASELASSASLLLVPPDSGSETSNVRILSSPRLYADRVGIVDVQDISFNAKQEVTSYVFRSISCHPSFVTSTTSRSFSDYSLVGSYWLPTRITRYRDGQVHDVTTLDKLIVETH